MLPRNPIVDEYAAARLATLKAARAEPNSPSGGYAPKTVDCPSTPPTVREASRLSPNETAWLELRRNNTITPMIDFLNRASISGFDATSYINGISSNASQLPNIGIAVSGGGYRALLNGAGFLAAADSRNTNSTETGQIGGLLQSATYVAGLSGGGWLVGSLYANNFSTIVQLRDGYSDSDLWKFQNSIFNGPDTGGISIFDTADYYTTIYNEVDDKADAGFDTSITDYWGRALSFQLINDMDGGVAYTFSSIQTDPSFINGSIPMPMLVADERSPDDVIVSLNSTVHEINPWEIGSWDPTVYGFVPTTFVGSNFSNGVLVSNDTCVAGFDQYGFVMGTSSSLFNQFLLQINSTALPSLIEDALTDILNVLGDRNDDISEWYPNPFYGWNSDINPNTKNDTLFLVDGGEDLQNIPLYPLTQPYRGVDVVFAVDSSADTTTYWPNGTALVATYQRSTNSVFANGTSFPAVPDQNSFVNLGLNQRPTFFGCDAENTTAMTPLVVYIPNTPYIFHSNVSTFDPTYNTTDRNLIIENGWDVATQGNGTIDPGWQTCVACAILSRSFYKTGTAVPSDCQTCFTNYCWNGTMNDTVPAGNFSPDYKIGVVSDQASDAVSLTRSGLGVAIAVVVTAALML